MKRKKNYINILSNIFKFTARIRVLENPRLPSLVDLTIAGYHVPTLNSGSVILNLMNPGVATYQDEMT